MSHLGPYMLEDQFRDMPITDQGFLQGLIMLILGL
jgi:hypothetical protein